MKRYILLIILIALTSGIEVSAQRKVLGLPQAYERPRDSDKPLTTDNKSRDKAWIVISDRDNNPVYEKASESSRETRKIQFRDYFYIIEEKDKWIRIAEASGVKKLKSKDIRPLGWIKKEKMLLWNSGLIDERTNINKKAFLLNRADDVNNVINRKIAGEELIVKFFRHPTKGIEENEKRIYDQYFVVKKEKGMSLLSEEAILTTYNTKTKLLGWVSQKRIEEWNTRISLEPNFDEAAFKERKNNSKYHFKAFGKEINIRDFIQDGRENNVFWNNDPVKFNVSDMAKNNPRRFKGGVVRFPMFHKRKIDNIGFFRSGVIGSIKVSQDSRGVTFESEIPEVAWSNIRQKISEMDVRLNNVNIFFVIESTDKTYAFQQGIAQAIKSLRNNDFINKTVNVKYGALLYKDVPEGQNIIKYEKLSDDLDRVTDFITQANFGNITDQDEYTAFYYGLKQSLKVADFEDNATNIIILMGSNGDYSISEARKRDAQTKGHESLITDKILIFKNLADKEIHTHSVQLYNDGNRSTGTAYAFQGYKFILETAKFTYNKNMNSQKFREVSENAKRNNNLSYKSPLMDNPIGKTDIKLQGNKPGIIIRPLNGQSLGASQINAGLNDIINESLKYERVVKQAFENLLAGKELTSPKMYKDGSILGMDYESAIIERLNKVMQDVGDYTAETTQQKLMLYTEVFLPLQIEGAKYPLSSYVLFMPETDLVHYQSLIARNITTVATKSYPEKRKGLYEIYISLIEQFAGQDYLRDKKAEDMTRLQVMEIMQGIEREGLELDVDLNVRIGGIRSEREVSDADVDKLIQRFNDISTELERILKLGERYDFCYKSDSANRYYWLKLDQVF